MPWPDGTGFGTWHESRAKEAKEVRDSGEYVHFSRIGELLYEKGSELP